MKLSRQEDLRLVTGRGKFTADWHFDGQLHAYMVRSDHAHAKIVSIDLEQARAAPGVEAILTAQDMANAGFGAIPSGPDLTGVNGQAQKKAPMPVLAQDVVRFVGQPVLAVIAQSPQMARDAAELVMIEYEELPLVVGVHDALQDGAPQLHASVPANLGLEFESGDARAVDQAFEQATHVTTLRVNSQRLVGNPMELRACLAVHDAARNKTVVYTPNQGMNGMLASLAAVSGWPLETLEVQAQDVGGSFGLRSGAGPEHAIVMLAARQLGRPVKWVASRTEQFISEWHGRALTIEGSVALDADGRILAMRFNDWVDLGAYICYFAGFIGTNNLSVTMGGVYQVAALHMRSRLVYTNTVPISSYRGAGRPDMAYAIERLIDQAAAEHGFDPIALRRKNFIPKEAFPYTTANGTVYDCGDFHGVLDQALVLSDYAGFPARRQASAMQGRLRGIGVACYLESSGMSRAPKDQVSCEFDADGTLTLFGVTGPSGQGHETAFAKIVGDGLGLSAEGIRYRPSDPGHVLVGNGTGGSRSLYGAGSAFKHLVARIIEQGRPHAASVLGVEGQLLDYQDGRYRDRTAKAVASCISLPELARALAGSKPHPLNCQADAFSGVTFPNGCHIAELEIDPQTGTSEVVAYFACDDLGYVVSPQLAQGQVHGGVVQGVGQAFGEHAVYDQESGQLLTGSFVDYVMPRAGCIANVHTAYHPVPTALNALGSKGVGEAGCSGSLPALANAMMSVLLPMGIAPMDMPFSPVKVWQALRDTAPTQGL
jgi:carbon-monoxide dehydrogenase large subunit